LRLLVPVAQVEAMRGLAGAAGGDPNLPGSLIAAPVLGSFAEKPADPCAAQAVFYDEAADETEGLRLQMPHERDVNPCDHFAVQLGHERSLLGTGVEVGDPEPHLLCGTFVAQLRHQFGDRDSVLRAYWPNVYLRAMGHPSPPGVCAKASGPKYDLIGLAFTSCAAVH